MENKKPLILIVNDDGIFSPGLAALCEAVAQYGDLLIVAPHKQQTSMGRSYPREDDLGIIKEVTIHTKIGDLKGYSVVASPAYAVAYAVKEISDRKPDLCISGINYGENIGNTLTYSGTIGATLQAADFGIPSLAISRPTELEDIASREYKELDWENSKTVIAYWCDRALNKGLDFGAPILNINVPENPKNIHEFKYTYQSKKELFAFVDTEKRNFNMPYKLPSIKKSNFDDVEEGSDIHCVCVENITSVTPIETDLTFKPFLQKQDNK